MKWSEVIDSPYFRDMPFKIEMNKYGSVLMHPRTNAHGIMSGKIIYILAKGLKKRGQIYCNCAIQTSDGVKVANVAWASKSFGKRNVCVTHFNEAPEICVEIVSAANSKEEMGQKVELYLARGAKEVWLADVNKTIKIFVNSGEIKKSVFIPNIKL